MTARSLLSHLPNIITLARLLAVPVTVYLILQGAYGAAFWLFVAAGVSDALDGFLAKRLKLVSEIGAYLDPLADKALLVSVSADDDDSIADTANGPLAAERLAHLDNNVALREVQVGP